MSSPPPATATLKSIRWIWNGKGNVKRLTSAKGYDGGAFFFPPMGRKSFSARAGLKRQRIPPHIRNWSRSIWCVRATCEIFVMNADGSGMRQVTNNGSANFRHRSCTRTASAFCSAPTWMRATRAISILYMVNLDGSGQERITPTLDGFDGFPMFTSGGRKLVFCPNRNNAKEVATPTSLLRTGWTGFRFPRTPRSTTQPASRPRLCCVWNQGSPAAG
ncbi:MAG: hypothetical protein MZV64_14800 [Ignavibacteriales bacterium]|nr:hypothetical protein [Ignavibacteriales bacterium]